MLQAHFFKKLPFCRPLTVKWSPYKTLVTKKNLKGWTLNDILYKGLKGPMFEPFTLLL